MYSFAALDLARDTIVFLHRFTVATNFFRNIYVYIRANNRQSVLVDVQLTMRNRSVLRDLFARKFITRVIARQDDNIKTSEDN